MSALDTLLERLPLHLCHLCGAPSVASRIFEPSDRSLLGAAPGRRRIARYDLCQTCDRLPDAPRRAERLLVEWFRKDAT